MKCYMVMASSGEYSDRTEWPLKAFLNKELAQDFVKLCDAEAMRIKAELMAKEQEPESWDGHSVTRAWYLIRGAEEVAKTHKYDPGMKLSYTGMTYYIEEAELDESR